MTQKSRAVGYHGEYYWSGMYWYIASREKKHGKPTAVGCGKTRGEAIADLNDILNYRNQSQNTQIKEK